MDIVEEKVGRNQYGWYIFLKREDGTTGWVHNKDNEVISSYYGVCSGDSEWAGYYRSEEDAKLRLARYKQGLTGLDPIVIGGE